MSNDNSEQDANEEEGTGRSHRHRSPNHPLLDLKGALDKAAIILNRDGVHQISVGIAHDRWEYKRFSTIADQTVAALSSYGLMNVEGRGEKRTVNITDRARRIIKSAPDRQAQLQAAALSPPIHAEIWAKYSDTGLPQDDVLREYLLWERPGGTFNENAVDGFIDRFRASLNIAGLAPDDKIQDRGDGPWEEDDPDEDDEMSSAAEAMATRKTPEKASVGRDLSGGRDSQAPVTLPSLRVAILEVPFPMSAADYKALSSALAQFEDALTNKGESAPE